MITVVTGTRLNDTSTLPVLFRIPSVSHLSFSIAGVGGY